MTEQTEITKQTEKSEMFRLFRYFRLFRHLLFSILLGRLGAAHRLRFLSGFRRSFLHLTTGGLPGVHSSEQCARIFISGFVE
jgi:hypothetical protein